MIKYRKIRTQLQVTLGIMVLLIITISGIVNYSSAKESLFNGYREKEFPLTILKAMQSDLQSILERAIETSELLASDPALITWFKGHEKDAFYKDLSLHKLNQIQKNYKYETIFAVNASTLNYWCEDFKKLDVVSEEDEDDNWYFEAIKSGVITGLNFDHNNDLNKTILFVNVLMVEDEQVIGVAGVGVDPQILIEAFNRLRPSENTRMWLVDGNGKVTLTTNLNEINLPLSEHLSEKVLSEVLSSNDKGLVSDERLNSNNLELAYLRLSDTEYKLIMLTPHDDLFPILTIIRQQTFWFSLVFLLLTLVVVAILAKQISRPLHHLQHISERLAKGDLEVQFDAKLVSRKDEIGLLSKSFNTMKSQLSLYVERVSHSNEQLEKEKEQLKITNAQLNDAIHKASESERLTQSFLANISHEIRTPMNSILGFSQLLEYVELESEEYKVYASHVVRGGQQLLIILDSIINLSKIESGVVKPVFETIDMEGMLQETFDLYKVIADQKGLSMHLDIDDHFDGKELVSDVALFQLVLNNLVSNAIKYTESGFVNMGYRVNADKVEFYFIDSGIGIADKDMEAVFKPFRQVQFNQSETNGGAGLGLAIVSKILPILGGEIKVKSELGVGSTFYVVMPLS